MKITPVKNKVTELLISKEHLRDDDNKLIANIWNMELIEKLKHPAQISGFEVLRMLADGKLTSSEAITRCRRKLQQENATLRGQEYLKRQQIYQKETQEDLREFNN